MKSGRYDISKIPDIYDCVKYDVQHNSSLGLEDTLELFRLSRALANIVIPQVGKEMMKRELVQLILRVEVLFVYNLFIFLATFLLKYLYFSKYVD